jgi:type II secretory ATPase GspE/PulE/Tfp pilus assembly ATPase PilB-like protein
MQLRRKAVANGMESLAENAFGRVRRGETTISEAIRVCQVD